MKLKYNIGKMIDDFRDDRYKKEEIIEALAQVFCNGDKKTTSN